jgi:hypothetical protein
MTKEPKLEREAPAGVLREDVVVQVCTAEYGALLAVIFSHLTIGCRSASRYHDHNPLRRENVVGASL